MSSLHVLRTTEILTNTKHCELEMSQQPKQNVMAKGQC